MDTTHHILMWAVKSEETVIKIPDSMDNSLFIGRFVASRVSGCFVLGKKNSHSTQSGLKIHPTLRFVVVVVPLLTVPLPPLRRTLPPSRVFSSMYSYAP